MAIRSILVHLDHRASASDRVAFAAALALQHDAHLIGLAPTGWVNVPTDDMNNTVGVQEYMRATMKLLREQADGSVKHFKTQVEGLGVASYEARVEATDSATAMARAARYCDLSIVTQSVPDEWVTTQSPQMPQEVLLQSGRPVLVLPYAGRPVMKAAARMLVAWNGSREAARALHDALPLLKLAAKVQVVAFEAPAELDRRHAELPDHDIGPWLARHGVKAEVARLATRIAVGETLLSHAADIGADLIVAGGYGHSRLRETLLGGVTRTLLSSSPVPVLFSH